MDSQVKQTNWWWYVLFSIVLIIIIILINDKRQSGRSGGYLSDSEQERIIAELTAKSYTSINFDRVIEDKMSSELQNKTKNQKQLSTEEQRQIINNLKQLSQ